MKFSKDSLVNAIYQNIKRGIQVTYDNECYGSCLILIYCGIDAMSYLSMPQTQNEVQSKDFIQWADKYISPRLRNKTTKITGEELFSARCAVVHTYTIESKKTRQASVRKIAYAFGGDLSVIFDSKVPDLVLLRMDTLRDAFFTAIDEFLMQSYADKQKKPILEARLNKLLTVIPYRNMAES